MSGKRGRTDDVVDANLAGLDERAAFERSEAIIKDQVLETFNDFLVQGRQDDAYEFWNGAIAAKQERRHEFEMEQNYWEWLPPELKEKVYFQIPEVRNDARDLQMSKRRAEQLESQITRMQARNHPEGGFLNYQIEQARQGHAQEVARQQAIRNTHPNYDIGRLSRELPAPPPVRRNLAARMRAAIPAPAPAAAPAPAPAPAPAQPEPPADGDANGDGE